MRRAYPDTWDNLIALGVLFLCVFLYFWRMYGFKVFYLNLKPVGMKPLITKKIAEDNNLTIEDLNFIYENNDEYELDSIVRKEVENFRRKSNLSVNISYPKNSK